MIDREIILLAVADYAHAQANDGESAPDYRWMNQYIDAACRRYKVTLSAEERTSVANKVKTL